jgi:hypothetical protein
MPTAIEYAVRCQIVEEKEKGKTLVKIAEDKKLSYSTTHNIWKRYQASGKNLSALQPGYGNCGPKKEKSPYLLYRASIWLKRRHSNWGAPFISLKLEERYPKMPKIHPRSMQRWFKKVGLNKIRSVIPQDTGKWAEEVNQVWQIDAKEQIILGSKVKACYLTIVDERSGTLLEARVFPPLQDQ